jgi:hypothetical protein
MMGRDRWWRIIEVVSQGQGEALWRGYYIMGVVGHFGGLGRC